VQRSLLTLLIAVAYLLLAGGPRWTLGPIAVVTALCILVAPRRTLSFPQATRALDLALLAIVLAVAIQLLPLPALLVSWLSPRAQPLHEALQFTIGASPGWRALSIDPGSTAFALACLVLGVAAFLIARAAFAGGGVRQFCKTLSLLAAAATLVAIVQRTTSPRLVMGLVAAESPNANPIGPFLNRNHFSAWLLMIASITTGYIIAHLHIHPAYRSSRFRPALKQFFTSGAMLSVLCVLAMVGTLLMTLSRSAALGLGAAALTAGLLARSRLRAGRQSLPIVATFAGLVLLAIGGLVDFDSWYARLQQSVSVESDGWGRLTIWYETLPLIRDFWLTGTGAGTYSFAMEHYQQSRFWVGATQSWAHFNNAHSHYVQLAAEGGLLVSVPALAAVLLVVRGGLAAIRTEKAEIFWVRIGAAAGLMGIAVQGLWEVPLVMPANAILAGVLAGLLLHKRDARRADGGETLVTPDNLFR
jgi:O-antigen ligase